jgi:hypothetical protein
MHPPQNTWRMRIRGDELERWDVGGDGDGHKCPHGDHVQRNECQHGTIDIVGQGRGARG